MTDKFEEKIRELTEPINGQLPAVNYLRSTTCGQLPAVNYLLAEIAPTALIVHGEGTAKHISTILKINRLKVPSSADETCDVQTEQRLIIPIRSLARPAANRWASWRGGYLDQVAIRVRHKLSV